MKNNYVIWIFLSALLTSHAFATSNSDCHRVDADMKSFDAVILSMQKDFDRHPVDIQNKVWVAKKISHMFEMDQHLRTVAMTLAFDNKYNELEKKCFWKALAPRWQTIDSMNTADLKKLMKVYTWIWISDFGLEINDKAWHLAQHADQDRAFQKEVLVIIGEAYPRGEDLARHYAFLYDRVTWYGDGIPQKYATQGQCVSPGDWQPKPTEDFGNVNIRRAQMGLDSYEANKTRLDKVCR